MIVINNSNLILALAAGILLGLIFFGSLWWTIQKGLCSSRPVLWFSSSLFLRTAFALSGFYFIGRSDWQRLLLCLLGFVIARLMVKQFIPRNSGDNPCT